MPRRDTGPGRGDALHAMLDRMSVLPAATRRLDRLLATEPVVWISSVRPDGTPHLVPIWFARDGESLLVFSKPNAQKIRNIRANPTVMLALGDPVDDFDVCLVEGRAELVDDPAQALPAAYLAKYGERMAALGLSADEFVATYSQVVRIDPVRPLAWHGRTTPPSVLAVASIEEPVRAATRSMSGEPIPIRAQPRPERSARVVALRERLARVGRLLGAQPEARVSAAAS